MRNVRVSHCTLEWDNKGEKTKDYQWHFLDVALPRGLEPLFSPFSRMLPMVMEGCMHR
jgi:hypothetical protein